MAASGSTGGGAVGPAGSYSNTYGPTFGLGSQHGAAERGYGGNFGLTPPASPPRRSFTPPRRDRAGSGFMREPSDALWFATK